MSKELGKVLLFLRKRQNMTQKSIADKLKIDRSSYSNYERGVTEPDSKSLKKLADMLGVSVDYLLTGESDERKVADTKPAEFRRDNQVGLLAKDELEFLLLYRLLGSEDREKIQKAMEDILEKD